MTFWSHSHGEGEPCNDWCVERPCTDPDAIGLIVCVSVVWLAILVGLILW